MKLNIVGRNMDVTPALRETIEDKLGKLDKFFTQETEANVTLAVDKERHKIEVTIPVKGDIIRSEQVSNDMYVSIDLVEEVIERQLKKYKNKLVQKHQSGDSFKKEFIEREYLDDEDIRIVRRKRGRPAGNTSGEDAEELKGLEQ